MSTLKKMIIILGFGAAFTAHAETVHGPCEYDNVTLSSLTCYGPATLNNTTVEGELKVMGPVNLNHATVNTVNVKGMLHSNHSTIKGVTSVYGPIFAESTTFNGTIFSATNTLRLLKSNVKGNVSVQSDDEMPVLELKKTTLNGDVIFTEKAGQVKRDNSVTIAGKIINEIKQ